MPVESRTRCGTKAPKPRQDAGAAAAAVDEPPDDEDDPAEDDPEEPDEDEDDADEDDADDVADELVDGSDELELARLSVR